MGDPYSQSAKSTTYPMLAVSMCCAGLFVLLSSCSVELPVQREARQGEGGGLPVSYSVVFVIHGDGDYLYHDTEGNDYRADEEALAAATTVAQRNPNAEVFIFHQKPRSRFLLLFPRRDGEFSYYRNGRLIANESYWRDQEQSHYDPEVELYRRFHADTERRMVRLFLYCGHEIPEFGGRGYDASYPDRTFTVDDFATGLRGFTDAAGRFDLMVLSTCFGGTPYTIDAVGSFARHIIASPDNLHLSYLDISPLERLDLSLGAGDVPALATGFASQAFTRLTGDIQTAVSVAVYDVDRVQGFIRSVQGTYARTLTTLKSEASVSPVAIEHCDCADLPPYVLPTMNEGVEVFFRPALFGRSKDKQSHSGWECWRERPPQTATSQTVQRVPD